MRGHNKLKHGNLDWAGVETPHYNAFTPSTPSPTKDIANRLDFIYPCWYRRNPGARRAQGTKFSEH